MRQIGSRPLWVGHAGDTRDARALMAADIQAVIELADNEQMAVLPRELIRCRFPLSDGGEIPSWLIRLAIDSVAALLRAGTRTLVACSGGMSRSVCIAAGGLAIVDGVPLLIALNMIVESGPVDISPRLLHEVERALSDRCEEPNDKF